LAVLVFAFVAFAVPLFAGAVLAAAGFAEAVAAVFEVAAGGFAGVAAVGAGVAAADGVFGWGVDGFCPPMTGTTHAATTAIEIRTLVDRVGCSMLSLQRDELSNRCSGRIWPSIYLILISLCLLLECA
jgi:hypothetical protein